MGSVLKPMVRTHLLKPALQNRVQTGSVDASAPSPTGVMARLKKA